MDNQAQTEFDTGAAHHTLLIGLDYQDVDVGSGQTFAGAPPLDVFDPVYGTPVPDPPVFSDTDTGQEQLGLYVQDQIEFTDRWVLSLNGRHDRAETVTVNQTAGTTSEQEDEAFTGRAGLVYLDDNDFAPYVSYSESFLPSLGTDPETGRQIETGVKYQPPGGNGFVTLALFELTREDVVETDPATFLPVQTGEVRSRGIELEAVASFDNGLDLTASYSYLDMEITESVDPQEVGERPTQVPDQQASIWADNRFSLNVQNALDDEHVSGCFVRSSVLCTYGQTRTVSGSIRYRW